MSSSQPASPPSWDRDLDERSPTPDTFEHIIDRRQARGLSMRHCISRHPAVALATHSVVRWRDAGTMTSAADVGSRAVAYRPQDTISLW
jgi:hypothetical protein